MNARLLIIDPQNDFCDIPGAALPVSGADADMQRLAQFMTAASERLTDIMITLDSHPGVAIERTTFWKNANGEAVAPFTPITEADVRAGRFAPRDDQRLDQVIEYLHALEATGRYRLMVWPVHCVVGTWGHNIHSALLAPLTAWERRVQRGVFTVMKGMNPMTEQYSAVRAEVPVMDDPRTQTNHELIERVLPGDALTLVAGEASSHCVAATLEHLFQEITPRDCQHFVILRDCMSAVAGFETQADAFFAHATALGARVMTAAQAQELLTQS
jgi:nicotinamidase-related amidase